MKIRRTHILLFLAVTGFSLSIKLMFELFRQISFRKKLEIEKMRAELALDVAKSNRQSVAPGGEQLPKHIVVKQEYNHVTVPVSDILYLEAMENYTRIYRIGGDHILSHSSLKSLQEMLPGNAFLRIHRSYLISTDKVEFFTKSKVKLVGEEKVLPVGRQFAAGIQNRLEPQPLAATQAHNH